MKKGDVIVNPKSGRTVKVGSDTYRKLVRDGVIPNQSYSVPYVEPPPKEQPLPGYKRKPGRPRNAIPKPVLKTPPSSPRSSPEPTEPAEPIAKPKRKAKPVEPITEEYSQSDESVDLSALINSINF